MRFAISTRTRYAVRLMCALARQYGTNPLRLSAVSESERISEKYLSQIIIPLKAAGLVEATRGARGGYSLRRFPDTVTVLEIAEIMEGPVQVVPCIDLDSEDADGCDHERECDARSTWCLLNRRIRDTLGGITLADMICDDVS
jgi:Rrf2 family transcriptional regulator, cysteine metabolism repressor